MNPDQTALWSSLICVHIVCNIGYQSITAGNRADKVVTVGKMVKKKILILCLLIIRIFTDCIVFMS